MGRLIPGLVADAGFDEIEIQTEVYVDLDLGEGSYARDYLSWVRDLAPEIGVSAGEAARWASDLEAAALDGRFFFGLPWVGAICRK